MPSIFGDTSGWGHLVDPSQGYHVQAADLYRRAREEGHRFVTTNYILTELVALLTSPLRTPRPRTIAFVASLQSEDQAIAEDEAAYESTTHTMMDVPVELVPQVRELIARSRSNG